MNHLHDWREYIQEREVWPAPQPHLRDLLNAMRSRIGATPPDAELATRRGVDVPPLEADAPTPKPVPKAKPHRPTAQMSWDEYRQYINRHAQPHAL